MFSSTRIIPLGTKSHCSCCKSIPNPDIPCFGWLDIPPFFLLNIFTIMVNNGRNVAHAFIWLRHSACFFGGVYRLKWETDSQSYCLCAKKEPILCSRKQHWALSGAPIGCRKQDICHIVFFRYFCWGCFLWNWCELMWPVIHTEIGSWCFCCAHTQLKSFLCVGEGFFWFF